MTFFTRPILSDRQFTQPSGEYLELSGTTNFNGILKINDVEISVNLEDLQNGYVLTYDGTVIKLEDPNDLVNLNNIYELNENKSTDTNLGTSDILYSSQNAVKTYIDTEILSIKNTTLTTSTGLQGGGDLNTNLVISVTSDVLRELNNNIITGLKEFRRAGPNDGSTFAEVKTYSIGNDNLYKLHLRNTQNTIEVTGQVGWHYAYTYNASAGIPRTKEVLGFAPGAIIVIGDKDLSTTIQADVSTQENSNIADANYRYPLRQYIHGSSQIENGLIVGTDQVKTQLLINDVKAVIRGNIHLDAPVNTYRVIGAGGVENTNAYISLPNYSAFNVFNSRSANGHYFTSNGNFLASISGLGLFTIAPSLTPGGTGNLGPAWKLGTASTNSDNTVDRTIRIQIGTAEYDILARIVT